MIDCNVKSRSATVDVRSLRGCSKVGLVVMAYGMEMLLSAQGII